MQSTYQRITGNIIVVDVFFTVRGLLGLETEVLSRHPRKVCVKLQTSSTDKFDWLPGSLIYNIMIKCNSVLSARICNTHTKTIIQLQFVAKCI